jgi:hypothetical protein
LHENNNLQYFIDTLLWNDGELMLEIKTKYSFKKLLIYDLRFVWVSMESQEFIKEFMETPFPCSFSSDDIANGFLK